MRMWWKRKIKVHVAAGVLDAAEFVAQQHFPNEAGGALMGYWSEDGKEVVVTDLIGPGPSATHRPASFKPDYAFQEKEIERLYVESERVNTYLGDWHTHPNGPAALSGTDTRTLKNIASFPQARADAPIMLLLSGRPGQWRVTAWQLKRWRLSEVELVLTQAIIR